MPRLIPLLLASSFLPWVAGCGGGSQPPELTLEDRLPEALVAGLDALPEAPVPLDEVVLPNGQTVAAVLAATAPGMLAATAGEVADAKNLLIARLAMEATMLTMRSMWVAPAEGAGRPAQPNGLAYVLGGKRPDARSASATGCCPLLYGLDCSGFLHQVFVGAGVVIPQGPASRQIRPEELHAAFVASSDPDLLMLGVEDVGPSPPGGFASGDIVSWHDGSAGVRHVGIVFGGVDGMSVYCCSGSSGLASDGACSTAECDQNAGASRGPRTFRLDQLTTFFAQGGLTLGGAVRIVALPANMVPIAAGTFQMGSGAYVNTPYYGWTVTELPVHPVTISRPFWMGIYEVTQAEYQAVMGNNPSQFLGANRPVEMVSWNMAVAYCEALSVQEAAAGRLPTGYEYRLPTEAEWEYCCRAGTTTEWNVGSSMDCGDANFSNPAIGGYCVGETSLVGSYPPNAWGLHDMHGNVAEWCFDGTEGAADYPAGPVSDPVVIGGTWRRMRGGGWMNIAIDSRSAVRLSYWPFNTQSIFGFRVVCAPIR